MAFAYLIDAEIPKNAGALRLAQGGSRTRPIVWADPGRPVTLWHQPSLERDRGGHHQGDVGVVSGTRHGGMEPALPDCDYREKIRAQAEFHLAHVPGPPRWRRLFGRRPAGRRLANGTRSAASSSAASKSLSSAGSLALPSPRISCRLRWRWAVSRRSRCRARSGYWKPQGLRWQHGRRWRALWTEWNARRAKDGVPHDYRLISADRARGVAHQGSRHRDSPNDCLEVRSSGGGGWGPPARRSPQARQRDREQGLTQDVAATARDS